MTNSLLDTMHAQATAIKAVYTDDMEAMPQILAMMENTLMDAGYTELGVILQSAKYWTLGGIASIKEANNA